LPLDNPQPPLSNKTILKKLLYLNKAVFNESKKLITKPKNQPNRKYNKATTGMQNNRKRKPATRMVSKEDFNA